MGLPMTPFEIVAHRGVPDQAPENSLPAFERAIELGADAIELDVRLTADQVPVVYHYYYLHEITSLQGALFNYTYDQLQAAQFLGHEGASQDLRILTLTEVLEVIGGRIGLEIEIKGPEPEAVDVVAQALTDFRPLWETIELTSFIPSFLVGIKQRCPGLVTDLLFPLSEDWMGLDVVAYRAIHHARLAGARAVHLHPTQLSQESVSQIRAHDIEIHAWDVNDQASLQTVVALDIPRIDTDQFISALRFREGLDSTTPT